MNGIPTAAYAFAAQIQAFAESHNVTVTSIRPEARSENRDFLSVFFSVPRPKGTSRNTPVEAIVEPDDTTTAAQIDEPVEE